MYLNQFLFLAAVAVLPVARGRDDTELLLLDKTSGRIIRLNPRNGRQTLYSRVPNLPTCSTAPAGKSSRR